MPSQRTRHEWVTREHVFSIRWISLGRGYLVRLPRELGGGVALAARTRHGWELWVRGGDLHQVIDDCPGWAVARIRIESTLWCHFAVTRGVGIRRP